MIDLEDEDRGAHATGKDRQRRRTRRAIVTATQGLLAAGATPSVSDIADAADVSRRTIYQHFPSLDQLLLDATIGALSEATVEQAFHDVDGSGNPEDRVTAMVRALSEMNAETLGLGRALLKLTIEHPPKPDGAPLRGYRRVTWIEQALQPLRSSLDERIFQRLVSGLAMVVGWEALIVLEDVRGLDHHDRTETSLWAAHVLVKAALDEQAATDRR